MTVRSNYGIKMFLNWPKVTQQVLDNQLRFLKGAFITFKNPSGSFSVGELMNIRNVERKLYCGKFVCLCSLGKVPNAHNGIKFAP